MNRKGLSSDEVQKLLLRHGPNTLPEAPPPSSLLILVKQFKSPLVYVLLAAAGVTFFLRDFTDAAVISAAVLLNIFFGFYQERKAERALYALKKMLTPQARVIRDGKREVIAARDLVPGDLVVVERGDRVPADGILLEVADLSVSEAILTGESMPVGKTSDAPIFMATTVVSGRGFVKVTKTGSATEVGKIARGLEAKEEVTPLEQQLQKLAKTLAAIMGGVCLFIFGVGILRRQEILTMFTTSVAVAVAAIPEGLLVTLTVVLALGMQRILAKKALVRKLLAAETLGGVSVICVDKTGTLTEGKLRVTGEYWTDREKGIRAAILANDLSDPLEIARWEYFLEKDRLVPEEIVEKSPRLASIPFSPERKFLATWHREGIFVVGAPETLLSWSTLSADEKDFWAGRVEGLASGGSRLVGLAMVGVSDTQKARKIFETLQNPRSVKGENMPQLEWLGLLAFSDPVRPGVKEALALCQKAGIKVKVITGDHRATAECVMEELGLLLPDHRRQILLGEELEKLSPNNLSAKIDEVLLFARTPPEQKFRIVKALKERGEVVAMMGDGVNDAPALKKADIGIVVNEASDVAKETADMVLLDSNFATIVHAIEEGRTIFENIRKVVLYLLSDSFTEVVLVGGSLLLGLPLPVTAAQILWVNLVEDALPAMALAFETEEKELMNEPPRPRGSPILDAELRRLVFIIGLSADLILLTLFIFLRRGLFHLHYIQTVMFVALGIDSLFYVFACRHLRKPIFKYNPLGNRFLNLAVLFGLLVLPLAVYLPPLQTLLGTQSLGWREWVFLLGLGVLNLLLIEAGKWFFLIRRR